MPVHHLNRERLDAIRKDPKAAHWSQSRFESVSRATVLLDGGSFLMTKTEFNAPKLIGHSSFRTEDVGETYRRMYAERGNLETFKRVEQSFHLSLMTNYAREAVSHVDYTLWVFEPSGKEFVNLRIYPPGSYLLDLTFVEFDTVRTSELTLVRSIGARSSYSGGAGDNDGLSPAERTKTLPQLAKQNQLDGGTLSVMTSHGEFEGDIEGNGLLINHDDLSTLDMADLDQNTLDTIESAKQSEFEFQRIFRRFMLHLGQCSVDYRK
jgi:hypothetical protein